MLGLGLSFLQGALLKTPYSTIIANEFKARVEADGGTVESMSCLKADIKALNPIDRRLYAYLLDDYSGAAAAYSLRKLSSTYSGDAIVVRRDSDHTTQSIGFVNNELDTATLESFVNAGNVFTDPDITSATGWTLGANTTYNASTEAFDLLNENGLTIRQEKAVANHVYTITIVIDSVTSGGVRVYAGGTQSDVISTAGTHTFNITASTSNNILGINPNGSATLSISSFYAVDTTADGFVTTWYDQSGNGNDAVNATASQQPKIVSAGTSLGYIQNQTSSSGQILKSTFSYTAGTPFSSFMVVQNFGKSVFGGTTSGSVYYGVAENNTSSASAGFGSISYYSNGSSIGIQRADIYNATTTSFAQLTTLATLSSGSQNAVLGYDSSGYNSVRMKEYIIYDNQSVSRTGVEDNIITHYGF